MSNRQLSALRNMPIWIDRCDLRARFIVRIEGITPEAQQLEVLRDYMKLVVCHHE